MKTSIRAAASRLRLAVIIVSGLVLLVFAAIQLGAPGAAVHVEYRAYGLGPAGKLVAWGTLALLATAVFRLVQMLGRIAAGELFSVAVVRSFRGFAFWLLAMALFGFIAPILAGALLPSPQGFHRIAILLDLRQLLILAVTMLLFLLARLLERARELESEVEEFV